MPAIKADSPIITRYYAMLDEAARQGQTHEGNVRNAFQELLRQTAKDMKGWELITEQTERRETNAVRYDGTLRDSNRLPHGWWEAKDSRDDLDTEIRKKRERGYRFDNIIFEDTREAALYQDNLLVLRVEVRDPSQLADLLNRFYAHEIEPFTKFVEAVAFFQKEIPHIANGLKERIEAAHKDNKKFQTAFADFMELCKTALNPNISQAAVDEMLIQHMLSIRLISKIFTEGFTQRNVIAAEIEHVINSLTSPYFNPTDFLGALDRFYTAIEVAADKLATFTEKQDFINHVYERFFQGYSVKIADTHGIVYTPQPIVDFMCAAVEEVLLTEFGVKLGDDGVYVIDPCTGTGNFAVNLLRRAHQSNPRGFEQFYKQQLFANEVMLMPYYIASLNIEHEYYALSGKYEPFEGICFVDTLDLAEGTQMSFSFMTERNTARVERQKAAPITVILGNPPYNVGQLNENDNNKNRKYEVIDGRVRESYAADSKATNKNALSDPYVKFFRWASDRLQGRDGVVCYVSNNSFVDQIAFDGMRKHLLGDFTQVYHLDLHGNVRQNPKLSGTTHNVFGIQVGVGITVAVRSSKHTPVPLPVFGEGLGVGSTEPGNPLPASPEYRGGVEPAKADESAQQADSVPLPVIEESVEAPMADESGKQTDSVPLPVFGEGLGVGSLFYHRVPELWTRLEKLAYLTENVTLDTKQNALNTIQWQTLTPDSRHTWLIPENADEFASFLPMGSKETKSAKTADVEAIFKTYGRGVATSRDDVVYGFNRPDLIERVKKFIENYNAEVDRYKHAGQPNDVDDFVKYDSIKWSMGLKIHLQHSHYAEFTESKIRLTQYRPFSKQYLFFDRVLNEAVYRFPSIFPTPVTEQENRAIIVGGYGRKDFAVSFTNTIHDLNFYADPAQCFPFYVYDEDGSNRRENITDWALAQFRARYPHPASPKYRGGVKAAMADESDKKAESVPLPVFGEGLGVGLNDESIERWAVTASPKELYDKIKPLAREMRSNPTPAEKHLWQRLRHEQVLGFKFRRQHPIDRFIVDFYCPTARLVIEVDGSIHDEQQEADALRQAYLESLGLRVLRFTNGEVLQQTDGVVERIAEVLQEPIQPHPQPLPEYREGSSIDSSPVVGGGQEGVSRIITKWDIFYYVYGLLHHPEYRSKFADNLKRELPRIPFVGMSDSPSLYSGKGLGDGVSEGLGGGVNIFWAFADAGRKLAELHLNYETVEPYKLDWVTTEGKPISYRVEKMKIKNPLPASPEYRGGVQSAMPGESDKKADSVPLPVFGEGLGVGSIEINDTLTLRGIPPAAFDYKLGNRSALHWLVDQYQVSTDKRSGITSDPNRYSDDERYIVNLIERVTRVSLETVVIVNGLPPLA